VEALFGGLAVHSPFLGGVGDLPPSLVTSVVVDTLGGHPEPPNALTVPTWVIHVSSLVEWLVAMGMVWKYADQTGNEKWRGVTWGMLPLHSSGICACTYHLFYNAPSVGYLVALQAFLTCFGNATLAIATYRLAVSEGWTGALLPGWAKEAAASDKLPPRVAGALAAALLLPAGPAGPGSSGTPASEAAAAASGAKAGSSAEAGSPGFEDLAVVLAEDSDLGFVGKLLAISLLASFAVKYGELFVDFPFDSATAPATAAAFIAVPTALNMAKWYSRSVDPENDTFGMF